MPIEKPYHYAAFALWVAICAAAPEILWQGLVLFFDHLTRAEIASALLIGTLLAFFVEPALERIKRLSWTVGPHGAWPAFLTLPMSIIFGVIAVCIHEAVSSFVGQDGKATHFAGAIAQVPEWSLIPLFVTLAWFAPLGGRAAAIIAGLAAAVAILAIGLFYRWSAQDIVTTAIPSIALLAAGEWYVSRHWDAGTQLALARLTAAVAIAWFALVALTYLAATILGAPSAWIYDPTELAVDARFYAGWSLGLVFAPNPKGHAPAMFAGQ